MKPKRLSLTLLAALIQLSAFASPVDDLLHRILPNGNDAERIECQLVEGSGDQFTISCDGQKARIEAGNAVALATGVNWFLQHYAGVDISWNSPTGSLPETLPSVIEETHTASVPLRYYLNFCTHSYSMAFWGWDRWQQEIDWMALHGINIPLVITGMECVWKEVLQDYGYQGLDGVNRFVTGSAYYGWFFMNNMTAWGGPQPESWYEGRLALARKIFGRMRELGMQPVVPGYVGMIPEDFFTYASEQETAAWQKSDIVNGGTWCSFQRPYFVNNTERLQEFAARYYAAIDTLFGDVLETRYYAIDPFHEGGVPSGVTSAAASIKAMYESMIAHDAEAIWVCQHWQNNPTTTLTRAIPQGKLLILDLHGDSNGDTSCSGNHTDSNGKNHDWVWGQVSNFGGNVGIFGRMDRIINCFYTARDNAASNALKGIGALPEGIDNNDILYDLLFALPWTTTDYTRETWIEDYVAMRYGPTDEETQKTLTSVWNRLAQGILNCPTNKQQGTTESVFLMRPSLKAGTVSSWANSSWYWDMDELRTAAYEMLSLATKMQHSENYRYDLTDLMRQALADYGKQVLDSISSLSGEERKAIEERFLALILDQDRLLGTSPHFRLGTWIEAARSLGTTEAESDLYEKNARMLLTTWGDRAQCESGGLHDYANREWNGLLSQYYYPRWKAFFDNGEKALSWFSDYEWPFVAGTPAYGTFTSAAEEDVIEVARELYSKYFSDFQPKIWSTFVPDTESTYIMSNAEKWYGAVDTEGLNLTAPNSDYNGYRLKRSTMQKDNTAWQWQFQASADGSVKVRNVQLAQLGKPAYLSSKPSTSAYPAFTFDATGTDFYLFRCGDVFYFQEAGAEIFMAPDCAWKEACVLVSNSRSGSSLLHITDVETGVSVGIDCIGTIAESGTTYTLQGMRSTPSSRGILVSKGRKFLSAKN